jgi:lysophospholipase L1-like esterase
MKSKQRQSFASRLWSNIFGGMAILVVAALASCAPSVELDSPEQESSESEHWVGSWAAAAVARPLPIEVPTGEGPPRGYSDLNIVNQTLRQIANISLGGERFRVVLTNAFGTEPLEIGAAHVALRDEGAVLISESGGALTFGGSPTTSIPPGAVVVSDPVSMTVPSLADLAIDLYIPGDTGAMMSPLTILAASWQTNYVSPTGDHTGVTEMPVEAETTYTRRDGTLTSTWFFLARVEVEAPTSVGAVVTFGDSITNGSRSTIDTNNRWPDHLARRLVENGLEMGVLNVGIGGNRVLSDGSSPSALARFDRDVLAQTGATHVIVMDGINDIGSARENPSPTADDIIAGHMQLIVRAHARDLTIYGATLTPFEGANYWTPEGEEKRQAINEWIRTSGAYDGVIDFEEVMRDPNQPTKSRPEFDPGDHLHPNDAGYEAMANSIDLALLKTTSIPVTN